MVRAPVVTSPNYSAYFEGKVTIYCSEHDYSQWSTTSKYLERTSTLAVCCLLHHQIYPMSFQNQDYGHVVRRWITSKAAFAMINDRKPTPRCRHIDIQHFAIQEWHARGILRMLHIPGVINPADGASYQGAGMDLVCSVGKLFYGMDIIKNIFCFLSN